MPQDAAPVWWVEVIKVSPGLVAAALAVGMAIAYRREIRTLLGRLTRFKSFGVEAEFSTKAMDDAIRFQKVQVSADDRSGSLRRLDAVAPLLRDARFLWVDDDPASTRHERALLESVGVRITTVTTSAEAERELRENVYMLVLTDLKREGKDTEGLACVERTIAQRTYRWTIAYVATDQWDLARPAHLFGITNRPDQLVHLICDVVEREKV